MQHFPIFVSLAGRRVVLSGGGAAALAKLRLLLKTEARITVFASSPAEEIRRWAKEGKLTLVARDAEPGDTVCAVLAYAANENAEADARFATIARQSGALVNIVDNLEDSQFITPAIVDRDPVTVAIGTEGTAPVLARAIKAQVEENLPSGLGVLAKAAKGFRNQVERLPAGRARRAFWTAFFFNDGPRVLSDEGANRLPAALRRLLNRSEQARHEAGRVEFVGAGPGDPELLTLKARKALDTADTVIHDRLVAPEILELARREADLIEAGKEGFGPSMSQDDINELTIERARRGEHVVRLKSGDPSVFGRLDEEIDACTRAGVAWSVVPGITAASAATASLGQSLTRRGRNSDLRMLTAHDMEGFAEHDWQTLARPGAVAALYMAKRGARFVQGRLLMHGGDRDTPVSIVENASQPQERIIASRLGSFAHDVEAAELVGPAVILYGLAPRSATQAISSLPALEAAL